VSASPHQAPILRGPLAGHPAAAAFAATVHRVHKRYAAEVVAANRLCPFLRDVETGFGAFVAMLDPGEPSPDAAAEAILAAGNPIIHVVFPLVRPAPSTFERFAAKVGAALKKAVPRPPVMATFHPDLAGDATDPHKLIGVLRRAPDPFVQLIPEGMHEGGTVFQPLPTGGAPLVLLPITTPVDSTQANFDKLRGDAVPRLLALMDEIRADRDASYAPFLRELGLAPASR
jgi:hypothetical protein